MIKSQLRISEIFYSLQGESNTTGWPTTFIRLTGCPLRCRYCDTSYAFSGGKVQSIAAIIEQVSLYNTKYITVTGGEPLAQPACHDLLDELVNQDYSVSLETSGALDVSKVNARVIKVMDLKTPGSGEMAKNNYDNIDRLSEKDQIKFVIADDRDYEWSKNMIKVYRLNDRCDVLFSPVTGEIDPTRLADKIIADQLSVRFQIQLHKYLWNDIQGK